MSFDPATVAKIVKSLEITAVGIILTAGPVLGMSAYNFVKAGTPMDWRTPLLISMSAVGGLIYNTAKQWYIGVAASSLVAALPTDVPPTPPAAN